MRRKKNEHDVATGKSFVMARKMSADELILAVRVCKKWRSVIMSVGKTIDVVISLVNEFSAAP